MSNFRVFGLQGSEDFAAKVAYSLDVKLSEVIDKNFEDDENYARSNVNVRGQDVYVISSMYSDDQRTVADKILKYMFFIRSLVDASAKRITAVIPYLPYSRQDRKTESRAPINTKALAIALECMGVNRLLTIDVHNLAAFQNAFRIPSDNLESKNLILDWLAGCNQYINNPLSIRNRQENIVILSPDSGGMNRCKAAADGLSDRLNKEVVTAYVDKKRTPNGVEGGVIVGEIKDKLVIVIDDLIASGSTVKLAQNAVEKFGGKFWGACATHGLFTGKANENLATVENILITNSIPPFRLKNQKNVSIIDTSDLFAKAIRRINEEGSISDLLS